MRRLPERRERGSGGPGGLGTAQGWVPDPQAATRGRSPGAWGCVIARAPGRSSGQIYAPGCGRIPRCSRGRGGLAGAGFRVLGLGVPRARGEVFSLEVRTLAPGRLGRTCNSWGTAQILNLRGAAALGPQGAAVGEIIGYHEGPVAGDLFLPYCPEETISKGPLRILRFGVQVG